VVAPRRQARNAQYTGENVNASACSGSPLMGNMPPPRMICGISTYGSRAFARSGLETQAERNSPNATPVSETSVKNAKRRGAGPTALVGSILEFTDDDRTFLTTWFRFYSVAPAVFDIAEMLCAAGSAAAEELDELFQDSFRSDGL
jgi:hypothetical protein